MNSEKNSPPIILLNTLDSLGKEDFDRFKWYLWQNGVLQGFRPIPKGKLEESNQTDTVEKMLLYYSTSALKVTKMVLGLMNLYGVMETIPETMTDPEDIVKRCQQQCKSLLKEWFHRVFEGVPKQGRWTLLDQVYTELHVTEGGTAEANAEHEVLQIEAASRTAGAAERSIRPGDLFKAPPGPSPPIRTVLTKGVAGIGKTILTRKFTLDWAEDKDNRDVHFTFPLTFRELNVLKEERFSLLGLVHRFFTPTRKAGLYTLEDYQVLFILDGLDEWRLPLDFQDTAVLTDVTESSSVPVLLTNLIRGTLLPSARLWITTRPAAANQIPDDYVTMVTEVRGFTDPQKEEYFRKRFREEDQASRIISHIRSSRSLHTMCHIPVFCWITATVLEEVLKTREGGELPKTLTQMYIHHLVVQDRRNKVKYHRRAGTDPDWSPESRGMVGSLGRLAFEELQKGQIIFYEADLGQYDIDLRAASVYSGMFTQTFREEKGLYLDSVFCFIHLSLQEFLAALHVHQTFVSSGINLLEKTWWSKVFKKGRKLHHLHRSAVDRALKSPNGHLDLFLRFLMGLSLPANQELLRGLLPQTGSGSQTNHKTVRCIKEKLEQSQSTERTINLFHCLNELNDSSLLDQIQESLRTGRLSKSRLSPAEWSALVFILLSSEEHLKEFDLWNYGASEKVLLRLLPVVKASKKVLLSGCGLSERACGVLSSVLSSQSSSLTHLDLSNNNLQDSGVQRLCAGLESPDCKLEALSLSGCLVSEGGCASLVSALSSRSSCLRELDLTYNHPGPSGVRLLSGVVEDPLCALDTLRVDPGGPEWLKPGLRKYSCPLDLDQNSMNRTLKLSDDKRTVMRVREDQRYPDHPDRAAVYVDRPAGTLSFFKVSSGSLVHLYTFKTTSTEPLSAGFGLWSSGSSVTVCPL